jgi:hypothetical protein
MPPNGKSKGRFELLALAPINYSLTEGTSIPPPPDSPVEETAPAPAPPKPVEKVNRPPAVDTSGNGTFDGRGRSTVTSTISSPMSPTSARRPSSIRNFLARKSLANGDGGNYDGSADEFERPDSAASFRSGGPNLVKKKSWFRRLSSVPRTGTVYENEHEPEQKRPAGPPPPMLPQLNELKAKIPEDDDGGFGGEALFKNIT